MIIKTLIMAVLFETAVFCTGAAYVSEGANWSLAATLLWVLLAAGLAIWGAHWQRGNRE